MMKSQLLLLALTVRSFAQWGGGGNWGGSWGGGFGGGWNWNNGKGHHWWHMPRVAAPSGVQNATFEQVLDHSDPSNARTFSQFYYYDTTYWKGPGSPVIIFTPGEVNVTGYQGYATNATVNGLVAEQIGAALIVIEHRYWGMSSPFADLTTENLQYLTLDNALKDLTYFANNVKLPFDGSGRSNAKNAPWVVIGGSYSGALSAWLESVDDGTFAAYWASSAPVETISDYGLYFRPVAEGMPANCSQDVNLVINHMDQIFSSGSQTEVNDLKAMFNQSNMLRNDDFMAALANGPFLWQGLQFFEGSEPFYQFCDYVENSVNKTGSAVAGAEGVGLQKALEGYASWWNEIELPGNCASYNEYFGNDNYSVGCFDTYNASSLIFTDDSLANLGDRQWEWILCNEPFGYWQTGTTNNKVSLMSNLVTVDYYVRQCGLYFPTGPNGETYGLAKGRTEAEVNSYTKGWDINSTKLLYNNGQFDPWREAGVSSDVRPGGPLQDSSQIPVHIVPGGFHTSDLLAKNGEVNAGCKQVQDAGIAQVSQWITEWYSNQGGFHWRA